MIVILVVYNVVFFDPTLDPFSDNRHQKLARPNPIDMVFYNIKMALVRRISSVGGEKMGIHRYRLWKLWNRLCNRVEHEVFTEVTSSFPSQLPL